MGIPLGWSMLTLGQADFWTLAASIRTNAVFLISEQWKNQRWLSRSTDSSHVIYYINENRPDEKIKQQFHGVNLQLVYMLWFNKNLPFQYPTLEWHWTLSKLLCVWGSKFWNQEISLAADIRSIQCGYSAWILRAPHNLLIICSSAQNRYGEKGFWGFYDSMIFVNSNKSLSLIPISAFLINIPKLNNYSPFLWVVTRLLFPWAHLDLLHISHGCSAKAGLESETSSFLLGILTLHISQGWNNCLRDKSDF